MTSYIYVCSSFFIAVLFRFFSLQILDPMRGVVLDRFGLMHLIATNVCEWLYVVIAETRDDISAVAYGRPTLIKYANISVQHSKMIIDELDNSTTIEEYDYTDNFTDFTNITVRNESWQCNLSDMIRPLIRAVNPYLRPCGVEYSLLCSVIIAVIWNDICTVPGTVNIVN